MFNKEKLVYRILSGYLRVSIVGETFIIKGATSPHRYIAEEIFQELYNEYSSQLMGEDELYDWLLANELWSIEEDSKLKTLKKNIEEFQVKLFELGFQGGEKKITKDCIRHTRALIKTLNDKRHLFDHLSALGMATIEKNRFLIAMGLCDNRGKALFNEFNFLGYTFPLFDKIIIANSQNIIEVGQYREIARSDPWRQYWSAKEGTSSVFSLPSAELNEEQLNLISWTRLYDNIYQHPNCPTEDIIEDDDALDGFLIKDRREREKNRDIDLADKLIGNDKIKNSQEIYLLADTPEDIERVNNLNDEAAKAIKRERDRYVDDKGKVSQTELPDVKRRLQMELNAASFNAAKK